MLLPFSVLPHPENIQGMGTLTSSGFHRIATIFQTRSKTNQNKFQPASERDIYYNSPIIFFLASLQCSDALVCPFKLAGFKYKGLNLEMKLLTIFATSLLLTSFLSSAHAANFEHPGIMGTQANLEFIKNKVTNKKQPWKSGYDKLLSDFNALGGVEAPSHAIPYPIADDSTSSNSDNLGATLAPDAKVVYAASLLWYITGNSHYKNKAIALINDWAQTYIGLKGNSSRYSLYTAFSLPRMIYGAEILRYNSGGWSSSDINKFEDFLRKMWKNVFTSYHNESRGGNQHMYAVTTMLAIAVFLDDLDLYSQAMREHDRRFNSALPLGMDAVPELCRDYSHAQRTVSASAQFAEILWNQGIDVWTKNNNRILRANEYVLSALGGCPKNDEHTDPQLNCPVDCDYYSGYRQYQELILNAYKSRLGIGAPWTEKAVVDYTRPEGLFDNVWGTLLHVGYPSGSANKAPLAEATFPVPTTKDRYKGTLKAPNGAQYNVGSAITLKANASDLDGSIAKVMFYRERTVKRPFSHTNAKYWEQEVWEKIGEDSTSPYEVTWNNAQRGAWIVYTVAQDNQGATTADFMNIMVRNEHNSSLVNNLWVAGDKAYKIIDGLDLNDYMYIESASYVSWIPPAYRGFTYIQTDHDDYNRTDSPFMRFNLNQRTDVYVAIDKGITRPSWLSSWTDTGDEIQGEVFYDWQDSNLRIYKKTFSAGRVSLGANNGTSKAQDMYIVMIRPTSIASPKAQTPTRPTGLQLDILR
jgi:hypothetical protein